MGDFLLDSGIVIRHLRKYTGYPALLDDLTTQGTVFISVMSRFEILRGMREKERADTTDTLNALESLPIDEAVAELAGELVRAWRAKGFTLGYADVLIAASAILHNLPLVTTNPKHFPMPELTVFASDDNGKITKWQP